MAFENASYLAVQYSVRQDVMGFSRLETYGYLHTTEQQGMKGIWTIRLINPRLKINASRFSMTF